jgi:high-affinity Fe2+/Pb2+ permease
MFTERERFSFLSAVIYAVGYAVAFGIILVLLAYTLDLNVNRTMVGTVLVIAALIGAWHGIKAHKAKSKLQG